MDYWKLVTDSYKIIAKHRFLWILGIFAMLTEGSVANWWVSLPSNVSLPELPGRMRNYQLPPESTSQVLGAQNSDAISSWMSTYAGWIILVAALLILLLLFFFILSEVAKFGLVSTVGRIEHDRPMDFWKAIRAGLSVFLKGFLLEIVIGLLLLFFLSIFFVPFVILLLLKSFAIAIFVFLLALLPLLLGLIYFRLLNTLSIRALILDKTRIWEAIQQSHRRIRAQLREIILGWLVLLLVGIVISLGLSLMLLLLLILFGLLLLIAWVAGGVIAVVIFGSFLLFLSLILMAIVSGVVTSWTSTYWTLLYMRLPEVPSDVS